MTTSSTASASDSEIATALHELGTGNGTHAEGNAARRLLEAAPQPVLDDALPVLWAQEEAWRRKRIAWGVLALVPNVVLLLLLCLLPLLRDTALADTWKSFTTSFVSHLVVILIGFAPSFLMPCFCVVGRAQIGIVRLCFLRPHWQWVPLLIETLPLTVLLARAERTTPDLYAQKLRDLLIMLLPLWCREDSGELTLKQRKILLGELKRIVFRGIGVNRDLFERAAPLSEADADFCLTVLTALRRSQSQILDKRTRETIRHLPDAISAADPNRNYVQEAAQAILQQSQS